MEHESLIDPGRQQAGEPSRNLRSPKRGNEQPEHVPRVEVGEPASRNETRMSSPRAPPPRGRPPCPRLAPDQVRNVPEYEQAPRRWRSRTTCAAGAGSDRRSGRAAAS